MTATFSGRAAAPAARAAAAQPTCYTVPAQGPEPATSRERSGPHYVNVVLVAVETEEASAEADVSAQQTQVGREQEGAGAKSVWDLRHR